MNPIHQNYSQICEQLRQLSYLITDIEPVMASVATIPTKLRGQTFEHGTIEPTYLCHRDAAKAAAEAYSDLHIKPDLCTKTARRSVGVVQFCAHKDPRAAQISTCVASINEAKENIEQYLLTTYTTRKERFEALRDVCPGIMALHLYRQIRCFEDMNILKVHFTWQRKAALTRPASRQQLIERIQTEALAASEERAQYLLELQNHVSRVPIERIRLRRTVQPQPSANIWFPEQTRTVTAPLPLLIVQNTPITTKPIAVFDPAAPAPRRTADKLQAEPFGYLRGATLELVAG